MSEQTGHPGGQEPPPRADESQGGDSDFGDSFLREVASVRVPLYRMLPGERLGGRDGRRFELIEQLGEGAMGQVFRARDEELQRVVALKFLLPREEFAGVALREARAVAQLDHENIVRIFDVSEQSLRPGEPPVPFLVMEYLPGESLAALLRREHRLGVRRALDILSAVAAGLAHAHEHHVIHRDLKPRNIFLTAHGQVKLLDFGLAHLRDTGSSPVLHLPTAGTPPYMAPEQWRGEMVDVRTDLWAAGVLLHEMLTGEHLYPASSLEELRARVLSPEPVPPLRERHPELPLELEPLLAVLLAKEPARRMSSAVELLDELRELGKHLRPRDEAPREVSPQRRQVTLVFCRLERTGALAEELDPEDFGELEAVFHRCSSEVLQRHGGFLTLCMGDEVLACFGYPVAHEGDSERAVLAALALPAAVHAALHGKLPGFPPLAVKVGVHADMVVLDDILPELRGRTPTIQGEAPKVAAWLARQAGPDEVVLGHTMHRLVRRAFDTEALGSRTLEGGRDMAVYRVVRARAARSRFDRALTAREALSPLVGRDEELRRLLDDWQQARKGRGGLVLLSGEAGIGKSRLLQELRARVLTEQMLHLRLQCWSQFSTSAFHPIIEALRRWLLRAELSPRENLRALEEGLGALGLTPLRVGVLASLLSLPVDAGAPHLRLTPEGQQAETLEALVALLRRVAEARPVLLVVEDLHWADPSTLQLLGFLLAHMEGARVLAVLSARPEFRPPWPLSPSFRVLVLERLAAASTERLVKEVAQGRDLPEEVVARMVARTDGIPLFVEELTRTVLEGGAAASIHVTLQELLLSRLDMLPRRQKELVWLCAVVGRDFSSNVLALLTGLDEATLTRGLEGLVAAGLLLRRTEAAGAVYQFRHALIQEVAYQSLPRSARREHHRRLAQALEVHFPEVAESQPELLARHYTEAGETRPAIRWWKQAGLRASQRWANQEAVSHLAQALKLLRTLPEATALSQEELQLLIALGLPLAQVHGYGAPEVERTYSRAQALMREVGEALPRLELSYWGSFAFYFVQARFHEAHQVAELLVDLGQRQRSRELLALGHRMMATSFFNWGRMPLALEHLEKALVFADFDLEEHRRLAVRHWVDPRVAALAYGTFIFSMMGLTERSESATREALALAERIGHPHTTAFALAHCTIGSQIRGDARATLELADRCIALSREHRFRLWLLWPNLPRSWALAELGRPQEGLVLMRRSLELWHRFGVRSGAHYDLGLLASILLKQGEVLEGLAVAEEALALLQVLGVHSYEPELHRIRGELLRLADRKDKAREEFVQAIDIAREQGAHLHEQWARESLDRLREERGGWAPPQ